MMLRSICGLLLAGVATISAMSASSGHVQSDAPDMRALSATDRGGPLSVMTYNIMGLPWPVAAGRDEAVGQIADRLAGLRRANRQPHIVLLQEAFTLEASRIAQRAGYRHSAAGPDALLKTAVPANAEDATYLKSGRWDRGEQMGKQFGSGLFILSDYPITASQRMAYPDFACAGIDCLANKGVLIAHLSVPGIGPVSIVNTHLNARKAAGVPTARSQQAFTRQAGLMTQFVMRHVPRSRPLILGGDMNIGADRNRARAFFAAFARAGLDFVSPDHGGARRALAQAACAGASACGDLLHASRHGKDLLFARAADGAPMPVASAEVPFGIEPDGTSLSDHLGYVIDYVAPAAPPVRIASAGPLPRIAGGRQ